MNSGIILTLFLCCGWPLIVHVVLLYLARVDWDNFQWSNIRWPWSKEK